MRRGYAADWRPIIAHAARAMLMKYGAMVDGGAGLVRLVGA